MARSSHILSLLATRNYPTMQMRFICRALTDYVSGDVLDIGGALQEHIENLLPHVHSYIVASQKHYRHAIPEAVNLEFRHMNFPPFSTFQGAQFDTVLCCFALERIKNDFLLIREIQRVLRPGGKLIVITPNQKTSFANNPFNFREYTEDELKNLISCTLRLKEALGIYGN
ncbi:MAG TPA: class I SAM-dependent methyltransferase, partial [Candidatus Alistipes pullicola]|nr:class I SAM-dependent methyltransferase [Candidatus Alistipes pullicola]